jgi:hypothetical protein
MTSITNPSTQVKPPPKCKVCLAPLGLALQSQGLIIFKIHKHKYLASSNHPLEVWACKDCNFLANYLRGKLIHWELY